jgi:hypothetical protein
MAAPPTPRPASEPNPDYDARAAVWGFIWTLFAFKMATVVLIFYHLRTWETAAILGVTTWYWFPPLGLLLAGPILFRLRLRRVRARREQLRRAEWMLAEEDRPASRSQAVRKS